MPSFRSLLCAAAAIALAAPFPATAQDKQDQEDETSEIVVTSSLRVRQGGAQDIKHFRAMADIEGLPRPEGISVEGLMGDYDLTLPAAAQSCRQAFCLVAESMPASFVGRPDDLLFAGIGFASNIDAATWHRAPVNLVAVVDKSGSMSGTPLALVRASLRQVASQMHDDDQMSIILYGDTSHVHLQPTMVRGGREAILAAIDGIQSAGSTFMEAGLKVGYETAFASAPAFKGTTRLMLFTDEQPNVGRTDADGFMTMARKASQRGIGLTTIGVGVQFGDALAMKVSSVRGGNLFFIADQADVKSTFEKQLDYMVSELAHDLRITMKPAAGYRLSGIFGVPGETMTETPEGETVITVPSVFLSTNGGGIFVTLAKASDRADLPAARLAPGAELLGLSLDYVMANGGAPLSDRLAIAAPESSAASPQLRQAGLLVDEYLALKGAATAFHTKGDPKAAYALLKDFSSRLSTADLTDMGKEQKLVGQMMEKAALFAGYAGEAPPSLRPLALQGRWTIRRQTGFTDLKRGDQLAFTEDREMETYRKTAGFDDPDETEDYEVNERQLHLTSSRLVFSYRVDGDTMVLRTRDNDNIGQIVLDRVTTN